jgi:exopolysaccharide production protein ExoQ
MSASLGGLGDALRFEPKWARLITVLGLIGVTTLVAVITRLGVLPIALVLGLVGAVVVLSFRWPLVALAAFVALIPIEEVLVIDGLGTASRYAGILFAVTYGLPRVGHLTIGAMPTAAWAFLAWSLLSLGWALDPNTAWAHLPTLIQLFVIAILVADLTVRKPALVRPIMWVYSLSASATAVVGILTFAGQGYAAQARATIIENQDPAQFAALLVPAFVFALYQVVNGNQRILGGAVAMVTALGIVVSGTRGAWLAVVVVVLFFILPRLGLRRQLSAIALIAIIGLVTLQIPGVSGLLAQRAETAIESGGAGRTDIWAVGVTIYSSAPVLGVGFANFSIAYTQDAVRSSDVRTWNYLEQLGPHNLAIGTLIELGPIGLALLVLFVLPLMLRRGWGPDAAMIQAALASLLTLALFLDILSNRKQLWLIIGLAAGLAYVRDRRRATQPDADPASPDAAGRLDDGRESGGFGSILRIPGSASETQPRA